MHLGILWISALFLSLCQRINVASLPVNARPTDTRICFLDDGFRSSDAEAIASEARIELVSDTFDKNLKDFSHCLRLIPYGSSWKNSTYALAIQECGMDRQEKGSVAGRKRRRSKNTSKSKPFYIDFSPETNSKLARRGSQQTGGDLLVKAVGPKKCSNNGEGAIVYDLTAGLGQDSLVLACNGAHIIYMVERNPIVALLLQDAIRRLEVCPFSTGSASEADCASKLASTLRLHSGDSMDFLRKESIPSPDVIYLDPMFPPRTKSSKVKKGMSLLHNLLDTQAEDTEGEIRRQEADDALLALSFDVARKRVVVKRPVKAAALGLNEKLRPSYSVDGSVNRWDVYVK